MSGSTTPRSIRLRVTGRVQGVGFRAFVKHSAESLGLVGWVRNDDDGSVVARAHGDADAMVAFCRAFERGPRFARVEGCEVRSIEGDESWSEFEIH